MDELFPEAISAARDHARACYPNVSCGLIINNAYVRVRNAIEPERQHESFLMGPDAMAYLVSKRAQAVVYSCPDGFGAPTKLQMANQIFNGIPYGVIALTETTFRPTVAWGDTLPIDNLVGREFMHGVRDCYSLVRDVFRLGAAKCAQQGVVWPHDPVVLPQVARDDMWWQSGEDLYVDYLAKCGFREIQKDDVQAGDGFLTKIYSEKLNHAGVFVGNNQIIHHLPHKISMLMTSSIWGRAAYMFVRFDPKEFARQNGAA